MLVNKRFRNSFTSVKTYPGTGIESDHKPLVGVIRTKLKNIKKKMITQCDTKSLRPPLVKQEVSEYVESNKLKEANDMQAAVVVS